MDSSFQIDRAPLKEQPLSADEKRVLSEYFQLEGQRQFGNYRSMNLLAGGRPGRLFGMLGLESEMLHELSDKQLTLELSQREHWIDLIKSIHIRFYQGNPGREEIFLWTLISMEKHSIVQIETGREEYRQLLQEVHRHQLPLIAHLGERISSSYATHISLFYQLLNIEGLSKSLILL
ncbi:MAG: hypothetical protein ACLFN5_00505 [bacterium]